MKTTKKLLIALVIVLLAGVVVPNIVPVLNSTISVEASSVRMNTTKKTLYVKKTYTLKVIGTKKKAKWSSSNKSVVAVSSKGKVTAKKKGTATITAKVGSKKYTCKITVKTAQINKTAITLYRGNGYTLKVLGATTKVKWSSSNKSVATVNSKGQVTAKKKGTAIITAKMGSKKYTCKVTVKNPYMNKAKLNLYPYEQYSLSVYGRTSAKWKKSAKWASSNKSVATVTSAGRVKAIKKGTTKITATFGKEKYTCTVNVNGYVENKEDTKTGLGLLNYTIDILSNANLKDINDKDKIKGMSEDYYYRKILNYKDDFEGKYTRNCLNNSWKNKNYVFHIEEINGEKYLAAYAGCGDESYIRTDLYIKKATDNTIVFNAVSHFTKNSPYRTKIGEFVIKKEDGNWKVDKFPVVWF